ncbi:MAG: acetate--CoA ligase family protein [Bacteroidales bacterium]|nr:acetate--CoA ligase family protein [Bacteroidales bacterium]
MINSALIHPKSIVVVGASKDVTKPGGKILKNLLDNHYKGKLYVSNPKETSVQGIPSFRDLKELPQTDLAILAIAAKYALATVEELVHNHGTRAFIIISAGFSEESEEGKLLEEKIVEVINSVDGALIGPNCVGILTPDHASIFTLPIPPLNSQGVDFISGSGATAVFIIESALPKGLTFNSVFSVGNSAQIGVEEVLEYLDVTFDPEKSSRVKLLYLETINDPGKLLRHASSLIRKGCRIAAVKAGSSEAGSRAASSHTGALASNDVAVEALFRKAGIVRCYGREDLTAVAAVFMHPALKGRNIAIITHAGGPAVMLTDALSKGGLNIPHLQGKEADELLAKLYPGSSVANPIDFLATGTAEHLGIIIDTVDQKFDEIDGMVVIFGTPGLVRIFDAYRVLDEKMSTSRKPIFAVLPSILTAREEVAEFLSKGRINFPDEAILGNALCRVMNTPAPAPEKPELPAIDNDLIRDIINKNNDGYLNPEAVQQLLDAAGIPRAGEVVALTREQAVAGAEKLGFPVVMKVIGPVHKSDVGGVVLNVKNPDEVKQQFARMIKIKDTTSILLQPMLSGQELFAGVNREALFGHTIICGLGGIFIEVLKDVAAAIAPLGHDEALQMIRSLRGYKMIQGVRGQQGSDEQAFADVVVRLSALVMAAPEIAELDLNPLLGNPQGVTAVDARIRISK